MNIVVNFVDMEEHHIPYVLVIERDSYGYPWSEKIFYDCINNNYFCKVLVLDNKLIGYLITSIVQNECHIMNLCVKKEYRNFGYGKKILINAAKDEHDEADFIANQIVHARMVKGHKFNDYAVLIRNNHQAIHLRVSPPHNI